jgi:membrane-associated protein
MNHALELIKHFLDFFLHLDHHLASLIHDYGVGAYGILAGIIFSETGFVVTPFLPGDSLLFAAGALCAGGALNVYYLSALLAAAGILGNTLNYHIGQFFGHRIAKSKFVKQEYLERTHTFYEKHGGKTIIFTRFMPILRTFAPFVAGMGEMNYLKFQTYNIVGGILWIGLFTFAGFFFGNVPAVKKNFTLVIFGIIIVSFLPAVYEYFKLRSDLDKKK